MDRYRSVPAPRSPAPICAVTSDRPWMAVAICETSSSAREAGAEIAHINKDTWGDRVIYIVTFKDPSHHPRLHVTADGTVLNEGPK